MRALCFYVLVVVMTACGPTLPSSAPDAGEFSGPDSGPRQDIDGGPQGRDGGEVACSPSDVPAYGEIPGLKAANSPWDDVADEWRVSFELEDGAEWELRLHPGRGQLPDPLVPGSYTIGPDDSRLEDCAVCAFIRVDKAGGTAWYMADSGTLDIDEIQFDKYPGIDVIRGSLVEAGYRAVELSPAGPPCTFDSQCSNTACGDGDRCEIQEPSETCGTSIGHVSFMTP